MLLLVAVVVTALWLHTLPAACWWRMKSWCMPWSLFRHLWLLLLPAWWAAISSSSAHHHHHQQQVVLC
jgi:hypothetical protein